MHPRFSTRIAVLVLVVTLSRSQAADDTLSPDDIAFFKTKVQPILVARCHECHSHDSGKKISGGLAVDSRDALRKGGESGPAIVPKNLDGSLLIKAIRFEDASLQMPLEEKLPAEEIAILEEWVRRGAPDPRPAVKGVAPQDEIWQKAKTHWAFQPIRKPEPPAFRKNIWGRTPIDLFVLQRLQEKGLSPSPDADRTTFIRRATFDLLGLPPTHDEVRQFVNDRSPKAFEKLIDRLLDSPHYGERWGRYWLDVARYADTTGETVNAGRENRYVYAYTYRDYVIHSLNQDKPFDQFIVEQIAADRLPGAEGQDPHTLAGLGFLTVGKRFVNNLDDLIDDRIDVVTRGFLGLTVTCARCHDHKFDPVPTKDYYSLHGVFASCVEPEEGPIVELPKDRAQYADFQRQVAAAERVCDEFEDTHWAEALAEVWNRVGEYLLAIHDSDQHRGSVSVNAFYRLKGLSSGVAQRWTTYFRTASRKHDPVFAPWFTLQKLPADRFAMEAAPLARDFAANADKKKPLHPLVARLFVGAAPQSLKEVAERYGALFADINQRHQRRRDELLKQAGEWRPVEVTLDDADQESLRKLLYGPDAIAPTSKLAFRVEVGLRKQNELGRLIAKVNDIKLNHPGSPSRAMTLEDSPSPRNSKVYVRGDKAKLGPEAPRQFLEILAGADRKPFSEGSGRWELARAIADPQNPLTPRVIVNRVWMHHFGQGLVTTPSDFGLRGEPPTHPELLDYLASFFLENGWSLKKLHRHILLSSVYRQTSDDNAKFRELDPTNSLLWRSPRRRLDLEATRDTLLATCGSLDTTVGGRSVDILGDSQRRTIYAQIDRLNLPGVFTTFDFAIPDMSSPQRNETTVPTQALFLMNSPFVIEQSKKLWTRAAQQAAPSDDERIRWLYFRLFQREPSESDLQDARLFLESQARFKPEAVEPAAWKYGLGTFNESTKKLTFIESKRFTNETWTQSRKAPDGSLEQVSLTDDGGITGPRESAGAVRRWTSPIDGSISISGTLGVDAKRQKSAEAAGVRARAVLTSAKEAPREIGEWRAKRAEQTTEVTKVTVRRGDTIDFIATSLSDGPSEFRWSITIDQLTPTVPENERHQWNSTTDFDGPAPPAPKGLSPWEKYIQSLLLTNEMVYVN